MSTPKVRVSDSSNMQIKLISEMACSMFFSWNESRPFRRDYGFGMRHGCGTTCFVHTTLLCWLNTCLTLTVKASCQQSKLIAIGKYPQHYTGDFSYGSKHRVYFSVQIKNRWKLLCIFTVYTLVLKLYSYFGILQLLLKSSSKMYSKVIQLILLFYNLLILGVTWKAIIKRFDSILRHASLKLSRYTVVFVHHVEALRKHLVNKFGLFVHLVNKFGLVTSFLPLA